MLTSHNIPRSIMLFILDRTINDHWIGTILTFDVILKVKGT